MSEHTERQAAQPGDEPEHTARDEGLAVPAPTQPLGTGAAEPAVVDVVRHADDPGHLDDHGRRDAGPDGVPVRQRRGVRMRTVVFGLVLLVISVSVLVTLLTTARVDATAVTLVILIGAGAALVAGGLAAAVREARGGPGS